MSESSEPREMACPECGAVLDKPNACWLCGACFEVAPTTSDAVTSDAVLERHGQPFSFTLEGLMLVVTLISVCLGAFTLYPGLGILLAILMAPVFVRTTLVVRRRQAKGEPVNLLTRFGLFIGSFATAMVIIVVISVASIGTFCAVCLSVGREEAAPFAAALAIIATLGALSLIRRWVRARWRRDTLES